MDRQEKVKNFLMGGGLALGGLAGIIGGIFNLSAYVIGGILGFLGISFLLGKSSSPSRGWLFLGLGALFLSGPILGLSITPIIGFISLMSGGYILYKAYKRLSD